MTGVLVALLVGMVAVGALTAPSPARARMLREFLTPNPDHFEPRQLKPDAVADLVEHIALGVSVGLSVHAAMQAASRLESSAGHRLRDLMTDDRSTVEVLSEFGEAGVSTGLLVAPLAAAVRHGAPLGPALARVELEIRDVQRRSIERRVRRLPVQLLFPLVLCVLPAFALIVLVPVISVALNP